MGRRKTKDAKSVDKGESSTCMLTRTYKLQEKTGIINSVLNNPLLLDKILNYTVYTSSGKKIDRKAIVAVRRVSKTWLQSASRILKLVDGDDAVIRMNVGKNRYGFIYNVVFNGQINHYSDRKLLDRFRLVFSNKNHLVESVLPICLDIGQFYFVEENRNTLNNFLEQFRDIILNLCIEIPLDGGSMKINFNHLNFPLLRRLVFKFETKAQKDEYNTKFPVIGSNKQGLTLLQHIIENSKNLKVFILQNEIEADVNTGSLSLPPTIKTFKLYSPLAEQDLNLLTSNKLPNLETLEFLRIGDKHQIYLFEKILQHFRQQLTNLFVTLSWHEDKLPICNKFPLMEKLKRLKIWGGDHALMPELKQNWSTLVPNLNCLAIEKITKSLFFDLVQGSRFENVQKLKFSLDEAHGFFARHKTSSSYVEIISEIVTSFPSIQRLTLEILFSDVSSLKYLFKNLSHLKKLKLTIGSDDSNSTPGYQLVSIFLGISLKLATALVSNTEKNVSIAVDNPESIMNLKELISLTLGLPDVSWPGAKDYGFSDVIYKHGLAKMPKLQTTKLWGKFQLNQRRD